MCESVFVPFYGTKILVILPENFCPSKRDKNETTDKIRRADQHPFPLPRTTHPTATMDGQETTANPTEPKLCKMGCGFFVSFGRRFDFE